MRGNTKEGGQKVKAKLLAKDPDYFRNIAKLPRPNSKGGSFNNKEFAKKCGKMSRKKVQ